MANESADVASAEAQLREVCAHAGLRVDRLSPRIIERMLLLADCTATFDDCIRALDLADHVFDYFAHGPTPFSETEKATVRIGSLFSDIGKTGPASANLEQRRLIARMFSVERVSQERMSVAQFFHTYFPNSARDDIECFRSLGLDPDMALREFWNLHSVWTLDLLRGDGVPAEAVAAAATHHLLEHVNPHSMVAEDGRFRYHFGTNVAFDRPEKLVILLDKYDAVRRRGRRDHVDAIAWLEALIDKHPRFGKDAEFHHLIGVLDTVLADVTAALYETPNEEDAPRS